MALDRNTRGSCLVPGGRQCVPTDVRGQIAMVGGGIKGRLLKEGSRFICRDMENSESSCFGKKKEKRLFYAFKKI